MVRQFAVRLAMLAFAAESLRSLLTGASFSHGLTRSLFAAGAFLGLGLLSAWPAVLLADELAQEQFNRLTQSIDEAAANEAEELVESPTA